MLPEKGAFVISTGSLESHRSDLNRRPLDYESRALPLSYGGETMPWSGLEPLCLSAPPPQDGVSTNFTTRAILQLLAICYWLSAYDFFKFSSQTAND
jgi:hypothetical protein